MADGGEQFYDGEREDTVGNGPAAAGFDKMGLWLRVAQRTFINCVNADFYRFKITHLDYLVLNLVGCTPNCRQTLIAQKLGIKAPNLAGVVEYLVNRGYVEKMPDPIDRRANQLGLSPAGRTFVDELDRRYGEITGLFFPGPQGEPRRRVMSQLLQEMSMRSPGVLSTVRSEAWAAHCDAGAQPGAASVGGRARKVSSPEIDQAALAVPGE